MKNRMLMSILALVSAALLLVFATFAWFTVSTTVSNDETTINVLDVDASVVLQVCETACTEEINWTTATSIFFENAVPGDEYHYRLILTNIGEIAISTRVTLMGFIDGIANPLGYASSQSLLTGIYLSANNTDNTEVVASSLLSTLLIGIGDLPTARIVLANAITLAVDESQIVYFNLIVSSTIGNDYRNLALSISQIQAQLAQE